MANEKIVVIDDDQDLRDNVLEILENHGFRVFGCATAEAGLEEIDRRSPDLVIVDNMMPGMGGMALLPLLRSNRPQMRIIMITAFSTVDNAVEAMKRGADDYLAKPFRRDDLLVAVRRNIEAGKFVDAPAIEDMDALLASLANPIRRQILATLARQGRMRFMDITREVGEADHTKVNFHLKNLKGNNLICQDSEKNYSLTVLGGKMLNNLRRISG